MTDEEERQTLRLLGSLGKLTSCCRRVAAELRKANQNVEVADGLEELAAETERDLEEIIARAT